MYLWVYEYITETKSWEPANTINDQKMAWIFELLIANERSLNRKINKISIVFLIIPNVLL